MARIEPRGRTLATPLVFGAALIAAAPFFGVARDLLMTALPRAFGGVLLTLFGIAAGGALLLAARRIRQRRLARYGALAAAALGVAALLGAFATGQAEVDAVERVHVVAYGLLAFLFARAFAARGGGAAALLALLATTLFATIDEWVQWLVPVRVGEARDVALNVGSALPGLAVAWAVSPPASNSPRFVASRRALGGLAAAVVLVFAGFYDSAHRGHRIAAPGLGSFLSYHAPGELADVAARRAAAWRTASPGPLRPLAVEDYFLTEGMWRVSARNAALASGDFTVAWLENRILEERYAPVLDLPSPRSGEVHRWPAWKRDDVARRRALPDPQPYESLVLGHRIFVAPGRVVLWAGSGSVAAACLLVASWRRTERVEPISR